MCVFINCILRAEAHYYSGRVCLLYGGGVVGRTCFLYEISAEWNNEAFLYVRKDRDERLDDTGAEQ